MNTGNAATRTENRPASFRWKAFGIHLAISLTILAALLFVLFEFWFPGYLFDTDGGWQALRVIAGVDIILGPLLTLIAANPKKSVRELRQDFAAIGLVQALALGAGTWLAWDNRPYAQLWYDGTVYSMPWTALSNEQGPLALMAGGKAPHRMTVDIPFEPTARGKAFEDSEARKTVPIFDENYYRPWPPNARVLRAFEALALRMATKAERERLQEARSRLRTAQPDIVLVPTQSRYASYFLAVGARTGNVIDMVPVAPNQKLLEGAYPSRWLAEELAVAEP